MSHKTIERPSPMPISQQPACCPHGRLIDDVLTPQGNRTGHVRCLECGAVFEDPRKGCK